MYRDTLKGGAPGCETFLFGPAWLLPSKTGQYARSVKAEQRQRATHVAHRVIRQVRIHQLTLNVRFLHFVRRHLLSSQTNAHANLSWSLTNKGSALLFAVCFFNMIPLHVGFACESGVLMFGAADEASSIEIARRSHVAPQPTPHLTCRASERHFNACH